MHVLRQLHKALRRMGILVDLHPQPQDPRVEIARADGSFPIGAVDWTVDSQEIRAARKRLVSVQREGLYRLERRRRFDLRMYHESVDDWVEYRRETGDSSPIPPRVQRTARAELRSGGGTLVVVERIRASIFRAVHDA